MWSLGCTSVFKRCLLWKDERTVRFINGWSGRKLSTILFSSSPSEVKSSIRNASSWEWEMSNFVTLLTGKLLEFMTKHIHSCLEKKIIKGTIITFVFWETLVWTTGTSLSPAGKDYTIIHISAEDELSVISRQAKSQVWHIWDRTDSRSSKGTYAIFKPPQPS